MSWPLRRTARGEAVKLLKQHGIHKELRRGESVATLRDKWDLWLGWGTWLLAAAWFVVGRYAALPRLAVIPAEWRLTLVSDLVQFWTQVTVTFVGLVIPFTILLAGWLERQPHLGLALGPLPGRRSTELIGYVVAVVAFLGAARAATSLSPGDSLVLCDALVLAPLVALALALRTVVFASRMLGLLDHGHAARAIATRTDRTVRGHVYHEILIRAAHNVLRAECEAVGIRWNVLGLGPEGTRIMRVVARRSGTIADIDLGVLRRLATAAGARPDSTHSEQRPALLLRLGQSIKVGSDAVVTFPASASAEGLDRLADRCVVLVRSYAQPDVRPCLDTLKLMATNALRTADVPAFRIAVGTMASAVEDLSSRLERIGLLFGPEQVSEPFSELHFVRLVEIHLRDLGRAVVQSGESDFIGQLAYDLYGMLQAAVGHADLMTFTRFCEIYVGMYYEGLRADSAIAKDRCHRYVRDLLDYDLRPRLSEWRDLDESKEAHVANLRAMTVHAIDMLAEMAELAVEHQDPKQLLQLCVHIAESGGRSPRSGRSPRDIGAVADAAHDFEEKMIARPCLYALALTGSIIGRFRQGQVDSEKAQRLLDAMGPLPHGVDDITRAFETASEVVNMPRPVKRMLEDSPEYDTRQVCSVDTTTGPTWALAVSVMRALVLRDEQAAQPKAIPAEALAHSGKLLFEIAHQIEAEGGLWERLIGPAVAERTAAFRAWVQASAVAYGLHEAQRRAAMPISRAKVHEIESEIRRHAGEASRMRSWLRMLGCVKESPELDSVHEVRLGLAVIIDKDPFTDSPKGYSGHLILEFAMSAAQGETETVIGGPMVASDHIPAVSVAAAIEAGVRRVEEHFRPDAILVPWEVHDECFALPGMTPGWQVRHGDAEPNLVGLLGQVPIVALAELHDQVVVAQLGGNCTLHDIRPLTLSVEPVIPDYVDAAKQHYPDADETRLQTLVRVVLEEKIRFDAPPAGAVAVAELQSIGHDLPST